MSVLAGIKYFDATINQFLTAPTGPVSQQVLNRAERVAVVAKANVESLFNERTGALRDSIEVQTAPTHQGLSATVGTDLRTRDGQYNIGTLIERGTPPHDIYATNAEYLISEPGHPDPIPSDDMAIVPGYPFLIKNVAHPGTQPRPWLVPALESVFH